jgi:hypothetical protein
MAPQRIPPAFSPSRSLFAAMSHGSLKQAMSDQIRCDRTSPELKGGSSRSLIGSIRPKMTIFDFVRGRAGSDH